MRSALFVSLVLLGLVGVIHTYQDDEDIEKQQMIIQSMMTAEYGIMPGSVPSSAEVCFDGLGCFAKQPYSYFPMKPGTINPKFRLYSQESPNSAAAVFTHDAEIGNLGMQQFSQPRKLVIITHGFSEHGDTEWMHDLKNAVIARDSPNVIIVDWQRGARAPLYGQAAANADLVGRLTSQLVQKLIMRYPTIKVDRIHFIGFSLGGQVGGFFARHLRQATGQKIMKITGLDCAAPLFERAGIYPKREDAIFVEAVHTSASPQLWLGKVGVVTNYAHVDFYPNGGVSQPGCKALQLTCAHQRAYHYYIDAIKHEASCKFHGHSCTTITSANKGTCSKEKELSHYIGRFAADVHEAHTQIVYLKTNTAAPFCKA